ncbi:3-isopropylmalate dehydrogenase [Tolypocladium ophioglossoides CBS 100239]|uniref:3-isopropylmalate dehydrogenase n=1 Tax=Tolypocladium ophioglossoides (strain CBS 100239) TaxID=1163406 RepID=A0A0L0N1V9_TOLOC|nr:3-isopropylmalate dehydrogenase [Tolypocladium ophioglossoides CBS 100239]
MSGTIFKILVLPGDHVGPEVMTEALRVLDVIEECRPALNFERSFDLAGGCSIDKHGVPITEEVLDKASQSDAVLFGSVGGPKWVNCSPNPESGLLRLRQRLDAFANLRPCEIIVPSLLDASPLKPEILRGTKFIVVRENCGGAYFGAKQETPEVASDLWVYTPREVERCARVSAAVARILGRSGDGRGGGGPAVVWSADKANVLASGRLWRRVTSGVFEKEFPDIELQHQLADSMAMLMVKNPRGFNGVIHTDNTFGDILSDISGGIVGSLGTLPSASISGIPGQGKCNGIYEPVHGSAPDIAGKGIVNPVAQILSVAMMLRYSCLLVDEAAAIEKAVERVFDLKEAGGLGMRTKDMGGQAGTREVGDAICNVVKSLLQG